MKLRLKRKYKVALYLILIVLLVVAKLRKLLILKKEK